MTSGSVEQLSRSPGGAAATAPSGASAGTRTDGFNVAAHGLRGIASLGVLAAHIFGGAARHIYPHETDFVAQVQHPWNFGTFGVEIFFVISGFVILSSARKYDLREFAVRRIVRIYPLFFTLSLVFIALNAATNAYPNINNLESIAAGLLFLNLFTGTEQLTPNAWSLTYEVAFYVLTGLVVALAVKQRSLIWGSLAVLGAVAFCAAFPITVYFLIGVGLRLTVPTSQRATIATRIAEILCLAILVWSASRAHFDYASWHDFRNPVVPVILLSITAYFHMALRRDSATALALKARFFRYVGDVSYSLYLVHPFSYYALRLIFVRLGWFTDDVALSMTMFAGAVFAASFALTHVAYRLLERWPYQAVFHQRIYRTPTADKAPGQ